MKVASFIFHNYFKEVYFIFMLSWGAKNYFLIIVEKEFITLSIKNFTHKFDSHLYIDDRKYVVITIREKKVYFFVIFYYGGCHWPMFR